MKFWSSISLILVAFILVRCAQPRQVTGGAADVTPPQILRSVPKNFTTNFSGQTIMMVFDEYVQVKSLNEELVVSPPLKYPVTFKVKGKTVYFEIEDTLNPNTTYNFNFGNAIVDLNEGNPLDSNLFVYSTGAFLDSGSISGVVKDAYTMKPLKNATVMLFPLTADSAIYKGGPSYIAKTNEQGYYTLTFLQDTEYQIFALERPGTDYVYQAFTKVGFYPTTVQPSESDSVDFFLFKETDTSQYVSESFSREYFSFHIGFHSDLVNPTFDFQPKTDSTTYVIQEIMPDSFKFWIQGDADIDSVFVFVEDQSGYKDTINIDVEERELFYKKLKRKKETKSPLKLGLNIKSGVLHYFDSLQINLSRPPISWNPEQVFFVHGKDTMPIDSLMKEDLLKMGLPYSKRGSAFELKSIPIKYDWQPGQKYAFIFYSDAITDLINQTNDTTILNFKTNTFEDYGSFRLKVKVANYEGPVLLELLDEKGEFIRDYKIKSNDEIYHKLAVPGKYQFRLIIDENGNNKWDTGDLTELTLPETVVYYNGTVEIRPNWDVEETWVVHFKH